MRNAIAAPWQRLANFSLRMYLTLMGGHGDDARLLIACLMGVKRWANSRDLDFRAAALTADRRLDSRNRIVFDFVNGEVRQEPQP